MTRVARDFFGSGFLRTPQRRIRDFTNSSKASHHQLDAMDIGPMRPICPLKFLPATASTMSKAVESMAAMTPTILPVHHDHSGKDGLWFRF